MTKRRALLSVWDKSGIQDFGQALVDRGWEVLSTGGTARALTEAGVPVIEVSEVTGHPEMMDGRVKTLHPAVHAGILARRDREDDEAALKGQGYAPIDLVAVNLYPFRETVAKGSVTVEQAMEQVDIGGPTMIRSGGEEPPRCVGRRRTPRLRQGAEGARHGRGPAAAQARAGDEGIRAHERV